MPDDRTPSPEELRKQWRAQIASADAGIDQLLEGLAYVSAEVELLAEEGFEATQQRVGEQRFRQVVEFVAEVCSALLNRRQMARTRDILVDRGLVAPDEDPQGNAPGPH